MKESAEGMCIHVAVEYHENHEKSGDYLYSMLARRQKPEVPVPHLHRLKLNQ